jgi:hypothetical protein
MNKFEQLIEYVINDEQDKARELFHDIVVEKSRTIYESMMEKEEEIDEGFDDLSGDQSDDLIDDIEADEQGMSEGNEDLAGDEDLEGEEFAFGAGDEEGIEGAEDTEGDLEDRVVDLEDKLDELMAEFESLMGDEEAAADEFGDEEVADEFGSEEAAADEFGDEEETDMMEAVSLKPVSKPTHGDDGSNKKSPVAANSGAAGMAAKPVTPTGTEAKGRPAPGTKELIGKVGNSPAQGTQKPTPATKPTTAQASGVNTKSLFK